MKLDNASPEVAIEKIYDVLVRIYEGIAKNFPKIRIRALSLNYF